MLRSRPGLSLLLLLSIVAVSAADTRERGKTSGILPSLGQQEPAIRKKQDSSEVQHTAFEQIVSPKRDAKKLGEARRGPSMLDRFNRSTKRVLTRTKQMFAPRSKPKSRSKPGRFALPWRKTDTPREKKKSILTSWFVKKAPQPQPKTLPDWLDQPMP